jgi:F420-0:gamma-glutamyl ligase-like protein
MLFHPKVPVKILGITFHGIFPKRQKQFAEKLLSEIKNGNCIDAIVLVNNATDTQWFHDLASACRGICFTLGRVKFWAPDKISAPLQGQAILYYGNHFKEFKKEFGKYGFITNI